MSCGNRAILDLLPDYHSGHLDREQQQLVEHHVAGCSSCRMAIETMALLSGNSQDLPSGGSSDHLAGDLLLRYWRSDDVLGEEIRKTVEAHVSKCRACAADLELLRGLEADIGGVMAAPSVRRVSATSLRSLMGFLFRKPIVGFAFVAVVALLGGSWFYQSLRIGRQAGELASQTVYTLGELRRSPGTIPVVQRVADESKLRIDIPYYHFVKEKEYSFLISDLSDGRMLPAEIEPGFDDAGIIHLVVDAGSIPDGQYAFIVLEIGISPPVDTMSRKYPFQLKTAD